MSTLALIYDDHCHTPAMVHHNIMHVVGGDGGTNDSVTLIADRHSSIFSIYGQSPGYPPQTGTAVGGYGKPFVLFQEVFTRGSRIESIGVDRVDWATD